MRLLIVLACVALTLAVPQTLEERQSQRKRYDFYQVWEVTPNNRAQLQELRKLFEEDFELDFFQDPVAINRPVQLLIPPMKLALLNVQFLRAGIKYQVIDKNLQVGLDKTWEGLDERFLAGTLQDFDYDDYNTYESYMVELERIAANCPANVTCQTRIIGLSHQQRDLKVLEISGGTGCPSGPKRKVWVDCHIHAREWLTGATTMKIIDRMLNRYGVEPQSNNMINCYDWIFLLILNPDGYQYSFNYDRMWRKSRKRNSQSPCIGTDMNRNYDHNWGGPGASANPCSDTYRGDSVASEVETQIVQNEGVQHDLVAWVSTHTYGQYWLIPYGDCTRPTDWDDQIRVCNATADAIEATHGTTWQRGNSCEVLYPTNGGTTDWALDTAGARYSAMPELRGPGFDPPPYVIHPSYEEIWNGYQAMLAEIEAIENAK